MRLDFSILGRAGRLGLTLFSVVCLSACSPDPPVKLLDADPNRSGALGEPGVFGAFLHERTFRVRVDEAVDADVIVPGQTATVPPDAPFPPVIFVPGALVDAERYRWLGAHIASRGFTVIAPHEELFSLLELGNIFDVFQAVRGAAQDPSDPLWNVVRPDAPALVAGHSLGGVSAAKVWASQPNDFSHLVFLCSTTDSADDYSTRPLLGNERILSLVGSADTRLSEQSARDGLKTFRPPFTFAAVEGMIHNHVVENPTESELADDGTPTIDEEKARFLTMFLVDSMLADFIGQDNPLENPAAWPQGLVPLAR